MTPARARDGATSSPSRPPLSVLVTARDEEASLPEALASVSGWADELLVVVDPRTRDDTRDVAARAGVVVFEHAFEGSAAQCNWGLDRSSHRWVLVLDADERVSAALRSGVDAALANPAHAAYAVRRINLAFGHRLRFGDWGHDRIVRLLDRDRARFEARSVHGAVHAESVGTVRGDLLHDTLRSLDQYLPKVDDYARRGAADEARRSAGPFTVGLRPAWRFLRAYVLRLGFLDGVPGLVVAGLAAGGTFLKWARVWETNVTRGAHHP
jgi:glycosyltransferase involved in cell wall biosynthesis